MDVNKKLDFSKMMCNVMDLQPRQNPLEAFDFFKKHEEFHTMIMEPPKAKVLKYIALVYDRNSPLQAEYNDIYKRKFVALELAGFVKEGSEYAAAVTKMILCQNDKINAMIIRYITGSKSALYHRYTVLQEASFNASKSLLTGDIKVSEFNSISQELEKCEAELLSQDNKISEDLSRYYFEDKLELRPEDISIRINNGLEPVSIDSEIS